MKTSHLALATILIAPTQLAQASARAVDLYDFGGSSGYGPWTGVVADSHGNLFGTTTIGGTGPCDAGAGCGTVYELSPPGQRGGSWTLNVVYNFQDGTDGYFAAPPVTLGPNGSLYGYTIGGSYGTVFQLVPPAGGSGSWSIQILYTFTNGKDGNLNSAYSPLILHHGALYGLASGGSSQCGQSGCGSVFRLTPPRSGSGSWKVKTLYEFTGNNADGYPSSIVGFGSQNALFVSTTYGSGEVAELTPSASGPWHETILTSFAGGNDGYDPSGLVLSSGTIYGIAGAAKGGLAFELSNVGSGWTRTNIAQISHHDYGPTSLALGPNGTLIGTIEGDFDFFAGNAFQLVPGSGSKWTYQQIWDFNRGPDRNPLNVIVGQGGHLFGVLEGGDSTNGSIYELK